VSRAMHPAFLDGSNPRVRERRDRPTLVLRG